MRVKRGLVKTNEIDNIGGRFIRHLRREKQISFLFPARSYSGELIAKGIRIKFKQKGGKIDVCVQSPEILHLFQEELRKNKIVKI